MAVSSTVAPQTASASVTPWVPAFSLVRPVMGSQAGRVAASVEGTGVAVTAAAGSGVEVSVLAPSMRSRVLVKSGSVALHPARADGTSPAFTTAQFQVPFTLATGSNSEMIDTPQSFRLADGRRVDVFSAAAGGERVISGEVYARLDGHTPSVLFSQPGTRLIAAARSIEVAGGRRLFVMMRRDASFDTSVCIGTVDSTLTRSTEASAVIGRPGWNYQAYSALRLSDGRIIIPFCYSRTADVYSGPWVVDMLVSGDEGATWQALDSPKTVDGRGALEPIAVETASGQVAILARTTTGFLYRAEYDAAAGTLGDFGTTPIESPSAAFDLLRLPDGRIAAAWVSSQPEASSANLPRKTIVLGISRDGLASFSSFHVIATSASLRDPVGSSLPYIHTPRLSFIDGRLEVAFVRIPDSGGGYSLVARQTASIDASNVAGPSEAWQTLTTPSSGATRLQLVACPGRASFRAEPPFRYVRRTITLGRVPTRMRAKSRLTASALLSPGVKAGTRPAVLEFQVWKGTYWRTAIRAYPVARAYGSKSRVLATVAVTRGRWRVRAVLPPSKLYTGATSTSKGIIVSR